MVPALDPISALDSVQLQTLSHKLKLVLVLD